MQRFAKAHSAHGQRASAAFASRTDLFERNSSYLRDMGDPGANGQPHERLTLDRATSPEKSSFNRSSSAGNLSFGTRLGRQQMSTPRSIAKNPGPGTYEAKVRAHPRAPRASN